MQTPEHTAQPNQHPPAPGMWDEERSHPRLMLAGYLAVAAVVLLCSAHWPWGFAA